MRLLAGEEGERRDAPKLQITVSLSKQPWGQPNPQQSTGNFFFTRPLQQAWNHSTQNGLDAAEAVPPEPPQALKSEGYAGSLHSTELKGFVLTDFFLFLNICHFSE